MSTTPEFLDVRHSSLDGGEPVVDARIFGTLRALGGEEGEEAFAHHVLTLFLEDSERRMRRLEESYRSGDTTAIGREARALTSSSSRAAAMPFARACSILESASRTRAATAPDQVDAAIERVVRMYDDVRVSLSAVLETT